jgi:hypothetical protein
MSMMVGENRFRDGVRKMSDVPRRRRIVFLLIGISPLREHQIAQSLPKVPALRIWAEQEAEVCALLENIVPDVSSAVNRELIDPAIQELRTKLGLEVHVVVDSDGPAEATAALLLRNL